MKIAFIVQRYGTDVLDPTAKSVDGYDLDLLPEAAGGGHPVVHIVVTYESAAVTDL